MTTATERHLAMEQIAVRRIWTTKELRAAGVRPGDDSRGTPSVQSLWRAPAADAVRR